MSDQYHSHRVHIYYEDTDLSGVVYHANYLKYFERAREHMLGRARLVQLLEEEGKGFVVYKCSLTFKKGAKLGDDEVDRSLCGQWGVANTSSRLEIEGGGVECGFSIDIFCDDRRQLIKPRLDQLSGLFKKIQQPAKGGGDQLGKRPVHVIAERRFDLAPRLLGRLQI